MMRTAYAIPMGQMNRKEHMSRWAWFALLMAGLMLLLWSGADWAQMPQIPQIPPMPQMQPILDRALNEQVVMITVGSGALTNQLQTTIFKPPGAGPFPILLMNHGQAKGDGHLEPRARFLVITREFVERGYAVVLPMRTGFAASTGTFANRGCNVEGDGEAAADDLEQVLDYVVKQPWADPRRIIVGGQSAGGLATMAFGARRYQGVRGLLDFAGGLRVTGGYCIWKPQLINAFTTYGTGNALPSLWFYGANDSYFDPLLVRLMYNAYTGAGGNAKLIAYGPFKNDSHSMIGSVNGLPIWVPETEAFLQKIGMPAAKIFRLGSIRPPSSNFAPLDDADAIPYLDDKGRNGYRAFLAHPSPRAFVIAPGGIWGYVDTDNGEDVSALALARCRRVSKVPCALYAVDDQVVWAPNAEPGSAQGAAPVSVPVAVSAIKN
jgi:dienelactone hydrolase